MTIDQNQNRKASALQLGDIGAFMTTSWLSLSLYFLIRNGKIDESFKTKIIGLIVCWGYPTVSLIVLLTQRNSVGFDAPIKECWITSYENMLIYFFYPLYFIIFFNLLVYGCALYEVSKKDQSDAQKKLIRSVRSFLYFPLVLIICWILVFVNFGILDGKSTTFLWNLQRVGIGSQGFLNFSLLYYSNKIVKQETKALLSPLLECISRKKQNKKIREQSNLGAELPTIKNEVTVENPVV